MFLYLELEVFEQLCKNIIKKSKKKNLMPILKCEPTVVVVYTAEESFYDQKYYIAHSISCSRLKQLYYMR